MTAKSDLREAFRTAAMGYGRAGTADMPDGPYMAMSDAAEVYAKLVAKPESSLSGVRMAAMDYIRLISDPIRESDERGNPFLSYHGEHMIGAFVAGHDAATQPATNQAAEVIGVVSREPRQLLAQAYQDNGDYGSAATLRAGEDLRPDTQIALLAIKDALALATQPATSQEDARGDFGVGQDELVAGFKRALQHPAGDHDGWTDAGMEDAFFRWPVIVNALNKALASNRTATSQEGEDAAHLQTIDERDALHDALSDAYRAVCGKEPQWSNLFGYNDALDDIREAVAATPTPPTLSEDLRALSERATQGEWRVAEGSVEDGSIYIDAAENGECPVAMIMSGSPHNQDRADAAFIVAAVQYVLAQVKAS